MRFYRIPDSYRIPDKTKAKAELAAALATYRGEITLCAPAVAAAAPGVSPQERRQNAKRQRLAKEAKRQRRQETPASISVLTPSRAPSRGIPPQRPRTNWRVGARWRLNRCGRGPGSRF